MCRDTKTQRVILGPMMGLADELVGLALALLSGNYVGFTLILLWSMTLFD